MTTLRGSCLCGGVRFEIDGPLMRSSHCHCRQCQKRMGAIPHARAARGRRFSQACGSPVLVKFDEYSRSAQTNPGAVPLYGIALATHDDHRRRPPRRAGVSWRVSPARTHRTTPEWPIAAIGRQPW